MTEIVYMLKEWWMSCKKNRPEMKKSFCVLFLIYLVGFSSIFRANYNYMDDIGRVMLGYMKWDDFSRYTSVALATIIHSDTLLNDISPLPQLIAIALTAMSSFMLMKVFTKKYSWWSIFAILPVGLSPYYLECLSFKFDAPYMALSVFASVLPLLFIDSDTKIYYITLTIGTLLMLTTYQASSGIFIICLLFLMAVQWNEGRNYKECVCFFLKSSCIITIVMILFKVAFVKEYDYYVSTEVANYKDLLSIICANTKQYLTLLWKDGTNAWKIMLGTLCLCFIDSFTMRSVRHRFKAFFVAIFLVVTCGVLSYGGYLVLQKPLFYPRGMYGFGIYIAVMGLIAVNSLSMKIISKISCVFLSWSLFVFALAYGNALSEQKRYDTFRTHLLISDLSKIPNMNDSNVRKMQLKGSIGQSPVVKRMSGRYKILDRLIHIGLESGYCFGEFNLFYYYNLPGIDQEPSWGRNVRIIDDKDIPVFLDTAYHTIRVNDEFITIQLKKEN